MLLNLTAYFIIPIYTILFACAGPWFTTNFSVIGSFADRRLAFLIWGLLVGIYFGYVLKRLIPMMGGGKWEVRLKNLTLVILYCAVTTPYLPEETPFKAFLHVIFAGIAGVLLLAILLDLTLRCYRKNRDARKYLVWVVVTCVVSLFLLNLVGIVSSALEIYITMSTCILVRRMLTYDWVI